MAAFVATAGPPGWQLGQWRKKSDLIWEETKLAERQSYQFEVVVGPSTPDSTTIRLRMAGTSTEAFLLDSSVLIFVDGQYLGEYCGSWVSNNGDGAPPLPPGRASRGAAASSSPQKAPPPPVAPRPAYEVAETGPQKSSAPQIEKAVNLNRSPEMAQKLVAAAMTGDIPVVRRLLGSSVDPDCKGRDGTTPLLAAANAGDLSIVELLLAAGADVNVGKDGNTPMTVAFQKGNKEVLQALFGAAFQTLESAVSRPGAATSPGNRISKVAGLTDDEVPESALFELREVTARLADLGKKERGGVYVAGGDHGDGGNMDAEKMREEAVREAMLTIARDKRVEGDRD